jgi:hypothetical protein
MPKGSSKSMIEVALAMLSLMPAAGAYKVELTGLPHEGTECLSLEVRLGSVQPTTTIQINVLDNSVSEFRPNTNSSSGIDPDLAWFYSDPDLVSRYAGQFVALENRKVVATGSETEVDRAAPNALVIYVRSKEQRKIFSLGL